MVLRNLCCYVKGKKINLDSNINGFCVLIASKMLGSHISFDRSKNVNFDRKAKNLEKTDDDIEVIPYNLLSRNWFGTFIYTYMCVLSGMFCNDRMKKE